MLSLTKQSSALFSVTFFFFFPFPIQFTFRSKEGWRRLLAFNAWWWWCLISLCVFSSVQLLSRVRLFATPWTAARQASLSITNSRMLRKLMSIESVMVSNYLILCCPHLLLIPGLPRITVFPMAFHIRWPKYWSISISLSNEYSGLLSFQFEWLDLLAVQEILKSLLQHDISKASVLWHSAFFTLQLSHPYMTTGKP